MLNKFNQPIPPSGAGAEGGAGDGGGAGGGGVEVGPLTVSSYLNYQHYRLLAKFKYSHISFFCYRFFFLFLFLQMSAHTFAS